MKPEIAHLWNKIDNYPDKEENMLDIFLDAELAFLTAIDDVKGKKKTELEGKLVDIQDLMKETPFFKFDIWELDYWIKELKESTYWRDKIHINNKQIQRIDIKKWCNTTYNTLRYFLLSTGVVDLGIGDSGKQPKADVPEEL